MPLGVAAARAFGVLKPAPGGVERVAYGDVRVLGMRVVDGNLAAWHLEIDAHDELAAEPVLHSCQYPPAPHRLD